MAFDAGMLSAVAAELRDTLTGAKITMVQQPEKDEIELIMHVGRENHRLPPRRESTSARSKRRTP